MDASFRINNLFNDGNNILNVIDGEGGIVKILGYPSEKCDLIPYLPTGELLGVGSYGKAFIMVINGKNYAVKKIDLDLDIVTLKKEYVNEELKKLGVSIEDFESIQPTNFLQNYKKATQNEFIKIVMPPRPCLTKKEIEFKAYPPNIGKRCIVPKGSYICEDETFSEFVIGVYCGKLYRDKICINFFDVYSLFTCRKSSIEAFEKNDEYSLQQYVIMEKISGDLGDNIECLSTNTFNKISFDKRGYAMDSLYVQVVFAVATYQKLLNLSHNDLHTGNVFIEYITKDTIFNNQKIYGADWFHYRVSGKDIYVPYCSFIAKIGDFGLSIKYKQNSNDLTQFQPLIGNGYIVTTGFVDNDPNTSPPEGLVPNIFLPGYDLLYFSYSYAYLLRMHSNTRGTNESVTPFIVRCIEYFCDLNSVINIPKRDIIDRLNGNYGGTDPKIKIDSGRPYLTKLKNTKTALQTLLNPIYAQFGEKPKEGRVVFFGEII